MTHVVRGEGERAFSSAWARVYNSFSDFRNKDKGPGSTHHRPAGEGSQGAFVILRQVNLVAVGEEREEMGKGERKPYTSANYRKEESSPSKREDHKVVERQEVNKSMRKEGKK